MATLGPDGDTTDLIRLGDFELETQGQLSLRDVYNREYEAIAHEPGLARITVWGNDYREPCEIVFEVRPH
jgi:hypothetical protein